MIAVIGSPGCSSRLLFLACSPCGVLLVGSHECSLYDLVAVALFMGFLIPYVCISKSSFAVSRLTCSPSTCHQNYSKDAMFQVLFNEKFS